MSVMRRTINVINQVPKKITLTQEELDEKAKLALAGLGHIDTKEDYWDFFDKNHWALTHVLGDKSKIINGSFEAGHNFVYHIYLCKKCEGIFNVPIEKIACIFCGSTELEKDRKRIKKTSTRGRAGVLDEVHPDLYKAAVKDIQENGTGPSGPDFEPDWKYLEDHV